jgi:hypothetical protein
MTTKREASVKISASMNWKSVVLLQTLVVPERVRRTIPSLPLEQVVAEDRFILAATHLTPIGDLADVEPVLEQTFGVIRPKREPRPGAELARVAESPTAFYEDTAQALAALTDSAAAPGCGAVYP